MQVLAALARSHPLGLGAAVVSNDVYYVYILASGRNGTLYIGLTSNLVRRVTEHREHLVPGFTKKYGVTGLVWFETHDSLLAARQRERQMKAWKRQWKIELFRDSNPNWDDLCPSLASQ